MKTINNELIRSFSPCYDPSKYVTDENETLSVLEWVSKYRGTIPDEDIIWLLCHKEFLSNKDLRLFAVWCAREALKVVDKPASRSIEACNVAERYANGAATSEELKAASSAAYCVTRATRATTYWAAEAAYWAAEAADAACWATYTYASATAAAARIAADHIAAASQLDKLLNYVQN